MCREPAAASFSFREGAGRKLKGRDLRRIRNTIWECSVLRCMLDCIPIRRESVWWRLKSTQERKTYREDKMSSVLMTAMRFFL
jgi:hypothetical protein